MLVRLVCVLFLLTGQLACADDRVRIAMDASEAEQVLTILDLRAANKPVPEAAWQKLFATEPYRRLKAREKAIGEQFHNPSLAFSDEDFRKFVLSDELKGRAAALKAALAAWRKADLDGVARRDLTYLPAAAVIHAKVFPVIKPRINSFVWDLNTEPTIFLYLDPEVSQGKFENTVAHELHHIGLGSVGPVYDDKIAALPEPARAAAEWMGAFGEGFAMLAAAGGPDIHPHAMSTAEERARWDSDMAHFDRDLADLDSFFLGIEQKKIVGDAVGEKAGSFFGRQGPWYTVGYKMAVMVEKRYGRAALIETMLDPRCLLVRYNRVAAEENAAGKALPLWSADMLKAVQAGDCR